MTDAEGNITSYTTSDRDVMTRQISPVSGTTSYAYNDHGALLQEVDARSITKTRTLDLLDRVQTITFSDGTPAIAYSWDGAAAQHLIGRLASIVEDTTSVPYAYDAFGRTTQDGSLTYSFDLNGNRTAIGYPGGSLFACTGYDGADRPATMKLGTNASCSAGVQNLVTAAAYLPLGPLTSLTLGNGLVETRTFDQRYYPFEVLVAGKLDWKYTVDAVGNPTSINDGTTTRSFGYSPPPSSLYFLQTGNGPWGNESWLYDRIGNRTQETRGTTTDGYAYLNGHNPKLQSIALGTGGTQRFSYDAAGNEVVRAGPASHLDLSYDAVNRLVRLREGIGDAETNLTYDGRNFLSEARQDLSACSPIVTQATYGSEGVLFGRTQRNVLTPASSPIKDDQVFYFAGRPVAIRDTVGATTTLRLITTDHLGTPALVTDATSGATMWSGGFMPFGGDFFGAQAAGEFLRFAGQWSDESWSVGGLSQNLNRWYENSTGRYSQADRLGLWSSMNVYAYVSARPTVAIDPSGDALYFCSRPAFQGPWGSLGNHGYLWDPRPGTRPDQRSCGRGMGPEIGGEKGPPFDPCNVIPNSDGHEDDLMRCCRRMSWFDSLSRPYIPWLNDCQSTVGNCLRLHGISNPGAPGGRIGDRKCTKCPDPPQGDF